MRLALVTIKEIAACLGQTNIIIKTILHNEGKKQFQN
jgi:predicted transcriptional regulator